MHSNVFTKPLIILHSSYISSYLCIFKSKILYE
nr:MAG TPA: hypothetical protein [Caudoviricetes sp.]